MNKLLTFFLFFFLLSGATMTHAIDIHISESIDITQEIQGDVYRAGERVDIKSNIYGDFLTV